MRLDDHPRIVLERRRRPRLEPARLGDLEDPDARAEPRRLDPDRQPERLGPLAPALLAGLAEVDLGDPALAEQPLEDQLVDRHRGGEHAGADVGDVEALEQPLHGAVLAERPVQDREGDVAAEQPAGGAQVDLGALASASQRPSGSMTTSTVSWPAARSPSPTAAPERSETGCSLERPPRITATLTASSLVVVGAVGRVGVVGRVSGARELADGQRHAVARAQLRARARRLREHDPVLGRSR